MSKFILGMMITAAVLLLGGLGFAMLGFFPTRANTSRLEWSSDWPAERSTLPWNAMLPT